MLDDAATSTVEDVDSGAGAAAGGSAIGRGAACGFFVGCWSWATDATGPVTAQPIVEAGRFSHEAVAWLDGALYETEDRGDAAFYRFLPARRPREFGDRDRQVQLLRAATAALSPIYKAHKWFVTRGDLDYTALWVLYAATPLAQVEVISARRLVGLLHHHTRLRDG